MDKKNKYDSKLTRVNRRTYKIHNKSMTRKENICLSCHRIKIRRLKCVLIRKNSYAGAAYCRVSITYNSNEQNIEKRLKMAIDRRLKCSNDINSQHTVKYFIYILIKIPRIDM